MKTLRIILLLGLALASASASAKTLEITVSEIRNDKGSILVMARVAGREQPLYAMAAAQKGSVTVKIENIDDAVDTAEVSLFHDEDGDHKMKMGDRGPAEGYAAKKCKLAAEENFVSVKLYYPAE